MVTGFFGAAGFLAGAAFFAGVAFLAGAFFLAAGLSSYTVTSVSFLAYEGAYSPFFAFFLAASALSTSFFTTSYFFALTVARLADLSSLRSTAPPSSTKLTNSSSPISSMS